MANDFFDQRKKSILSKKDKSSKGDWDEKIIELCEKINSLENYYTTSSCSGRVVILKDKDEKGPDLFEFVSHNFINLDDFKKGLLKEKAKLNLKFKLKKSKDFLARNSSDLKFKQEPPIIHVLCKSFEDAKKLLKKVHVAGWKHSGIIACEKNFVVEIMSTEKLEFPLTKNGKLLVDENFLNIIIKKSHDNLKKGWDKIAKLRKLIK